MARSSYSQATLKVKSAFSFCSCLISSNFLPRSSLIMFNSSESYLTVTANSFIFFAESFNLSS